MVARVLPLGGLAKREHTVWGCWDSKKGRLPKGPTLFCITGAKWLLHRIAADRFQHGDSSGGLAQHAFCLNDLRARWFRLQRIAGFNDGASRGGVGLSQRMQGFRQLLT